jgi:hypothetical protein
MTGGEALPSLRDRIATAACHDAGALVLVTMGGIIGVIRGGTLRGRAISDDAILGGLRSGRGNGDRGNLVVAVVARQVGGGNRCGLIVQPALEQVSTPTVATGELATANQQLHPRRELAFWMRTPSVARHPGIAEEAAIGAFSLLPSHGERPLRTSRPLFFGNTSPQATTPTVSLLALSELSGWRRGSGSFRL